jgi:hypothetical protein
MKFFQPEFSRAVFFIGFIVAAGTVSADGRYKLSDNGAEVRDSRTGLIWQRCAGGASWDGRVCAGDSAYVTHEGALSAAREVAESSGIPWRLPNIKELASLVEYHLTDPAIDLAIFPGPSGYFWSSTPVIGDSPGKTAMLVDFRDGRVSSYFRNRQASSYRLVRNTP